MKHESLDHSRTGVDGSSGPVKKLDFLGFSKGGGKGPKKKLFKIKKQTQKRHNRGNIRERERERERERSIFWILVI